jgi:hypothetical protein
MKTSTSLAILAALVAFVLATQSLALASSLLFGASLVSIFLVDCTRTIKPLVAQAAVTQFPRPVRRATAFELAA